MGKDISQERSTAQKSDKKNKENGTMAKDYWSQ